jgi:hypothetical protein
MAIVVSSDEQEPIELQDIPVGEQCYIQIKMSVKKRGPMIHKEIPFTIEVSNAEIATFAEPTDRQGYVETEPPALVLNKLVYHYSVVSAKEPQTGSVTFKVTPRQTGAQLVEVSYDKKVSASHSTTILLEYKK